MKTSLRILARALMAAAVGAASIAIGWSPADAAPGDTPIFTDSFETGQLSDRWTVTTAVNGTAAIEAGVGNAGSKGAHLIVPDSTNGSIANISRDVPAETYGLSVRGRYKALSAGCNPDANYSSGNIPFARFFDANDRRVVGLYRINGPTCGDNTKVYVQHSGGFFRVGANMKFNTWYQFELRASVAGPNTSLVQVFVNGALKYSTSVASNGLLPFDHYTIHNEHANQVGNLVVDDVEVATFGSGGPPDNPCSTATPQPTNADPGTVSLTDNFEGFTLGRWTQVDQAGTGSASVDPTVSHTGTCAARLHVTASSESKANLQHNLPTGVTDVRADGWFNVQGQGASNSNVPELRIFSGTIRMVDVARQNVSGAMFLRLPTSNGVVYVQLNRTWALNTWHRVSVHAVANPTGPETVEVWLDGQLVHQSSTYELGATSFSKVMVGAEHFAQAMDLLVDDVVIKRTP